MHNVSSISLYVIPVYEILKDGVALDRGLLQRKALRCTPVINVYHLGIDISLGFLQVKSTGIKISTEGFNPVDIAQPNDAL